MPQAEESFADGSILCRQNEPARDVFVLISGKVEALVSAGLEAVPEDSALLGGRKVADIDQPGAIIGEAGLWLGHRTASVVARGAVRVKRLAMTPEEAEASALRNPDTGLSLATTMAQRISGTQARSRNELEALAMLEDARDAASSDMAKVVDTLGTFAQTHNDTMLADAAARACEHPVYTAGKSARQSLDGAMSIVKDAVAAALKTGAGINTLPAGGALRKGTQEPDAAYVVVEGELEILRGGRRVGVVRAGGIADIAPCLGAGASGGHPELRARSDTKVLRVPRDSIREACSRNPKLLLAVLRTLANDLACANQVLGGAGEALARVKNQLTGPRGSIVELSAMLLPAMRSHPAELRLEIDRVSQNADELRHLAEMFGV